MPAAAGLPLPGAWRPGAGRLSSVASVQIGGARQGLAWRRPASCSRGERSRVEAALGDGAPRCSYLWRWWWPSSSAQILAGGDGSARRRRAAPMAVTEMMVERRPWTAAGGAGHRGRSTRPRPRSGPFGPGSGWLGPVDRLVSGAPGLGAHPLTMVMDGWGARSGPGGPRSGSCLAVPYGLCGFDGRERPAY